MMKLMDNQSETYHQQPQETQLRRLRAVRRKSRSLREWVLHMLAVDEVRPVQRLTMPNWLCGRGIAFYFLALIVVTLLYFAYALPWYYMLSGAVSVMVFFGYGQSLSQKMQPEKVKEKRFAQRIFGIAFGLRLAWMLMIYYIFMETYGNPFGFDNADAEFYDRMGQFAAGLVENGNFNFAQNISQKWSWVDVSDMGYGIYVGLVYYLTDNSILTLRILKCLWSALTVVLIYRLTNRHFGEKVARIAAIFCALWPNFWYYCGCHLKEVEMVFLAVLFVEQGDQMLRSHQFTVWKIVPLLLIVGVLFTIRVPLALVCILALLFTIVMSSSRVVGWGKRIAIGTIALALVAITMGERIEQNAYQLIEQTQSGAQKNNMEWRSRRVDSAGNSQAFAKYAGAAVFAPMIFTIPFPSMVRPYEGQELQQLLNGGNFLKNVMSFFTILAIVVLLYTGDWRRYMLPLSLMLGYIMVLIMSNFAHSERFHQPVMPFEWMFIAYGLSLAVGNRRYQRWFKYWTMIMLVAVVAWCWFKLAGRGMA